MAKDEPKPQVDLISAEEFAKNWDTERRVHELNRMAFHLRGTTMYVPARTKADMDETMGGPTAAVRTRTFPEDFRVWVSPCPASAPNARKLRPTSDTQAAAEFGFGIPLKKLGIKVPDTRQYTFEAKRLLVEGGGVVYEISFREYENIRREVDEAALAAAKKEKAEKAKARRSKKKVGSPNQSPPATGG